MKLVGFFDGSCWPNPHGIAGYGFVVYQNDIRIHDGYALVGRGHGMTNNVAEAAGLCALLDYLLSENLDESFEVIIKGDSQVVLNVVTGKKKNPRGFFVDQAFAAREKFIALNKITPVSLEWIPREMNLEADDLAAAGAASVDPR